MRLLPVALLALALALAPTALASDCEDYVVLGTADTGYYFIDSDACQPDCLFSVWVYSDDDADPCDEETNTVVL